MDQLTAMRQDLARLYQQEIGKDLSMQDIPLVDLPDGANFIEVLNQEWSQLKAIVGRQQIPEMMPAIEICESNNDFLILIDLPGVKKKDISVTLQNNILNVRGQRKFHEDENYRQVNTERPYGSFLRTINLPSQLKDEVIEAEFTDGVLKVRCQRAVPDQSQTININVK